MFIAGSCWNRGVTRPKKPVQLDVINDLGVTVPPCLECQHQLLKHVTPRGQLGLCWAYDCSCGSFAPDGWAADALWGTLRQRNEVLSYLSTFSGFNRGSASPG